MIQTENRIIWADLLRIISINAVILLHSAAPHVLDYNKSGADLWWIANIYDSITRWCIPVFFMLSGLFVIEKACSDSLAVFFRKRFTHIFIPFVLWSCFYFLWRIYINEENLSPGSFFPLFLKEPLAPHLWYLYILVEFYVFAPLFCVYAENAGRSSIIFFLVIWFLLCSLIPTAKSVFPFDTYFTIGGGTSYTIFNLSGYFFMGYFFRDTRFGGAAIIFFLLLFIISFFITAYGTYYLTVVRNRGVFDEPFYRYFSVNVLIMSVSVYSIVKSIRLPAALIRFEEKHRIIFAIAACVPGIYFIHAMLINLLWDRMAVPSAGTFAGVPALLIPLFGLGVFTGSLVIIFIIKKIPVVKHIVP